MAASQRIVTMKPDFLAEVNKLSAKEAYQIYNKVQMLTQDPTPDAKVKKQLKYMHSGRKIHRIRSGYYRVFYTFDLQCISILALRRRDDDTYEDALDEEFLGGLAVDPTEEGIPVRTFSPVKQFDWEKVQPQLQVFPEPITIELLHKLTIPVAYHARLLLLTDRDALYDCPGLDDDTILRIDRYLFETPIEEIVEQPDLVLSQAKDLLRYHEGELLTFLLKLSPEQEKLVNRAIAASGPTLVKGGPGSGKSTVALYRVRALLQKLRQEGKTEPCILFTTYTNALVNSSRQQLEQLLGRDIDCVKVQTSDSIISGVLSKLGKRREILEGEEFQRLFLEAARDPHFEGNPLQQQVQRRMLEKLGNDYLLQEICDVIEARQIRSVEEYQVAARHGRCIRLNTIHRKVIWSIYTRFCILVEASGKETWQMRRARAADLIDQSSEYQSYDAVIIDEAQDLDPSALRFLVKLCSVPHQIFVTADANQSIYRGGFNWSDVHENLNFKGRTSILQTNYRSTKEIGEAAHSYLRAESLLDHEIADHKYEHSGPIPVVSVMSSQELEIRLLAQFFRMAARNLHHSLSSCALLCPKEQIGRSLAQGLQARGVEATFMKGNELSLSRSGIKILTVNSSKGLEFPIVALAGFRGSNYAVALTEGSAEEREEALAKMRRTIFVGMTRAMRALLLVRPESADSPLMQGFQAQYWNMSTETV